jgi:hypothetical protein
MDLVLAYCNTNHRPGMKLEYEKYLKEHSYTEIIDLTNEQLEEIKNLLLTTMCLTNFDNTWINIATELRTKKCCHYNEDRTECKIHLELGENSATLYQDCFFLHYNVVYSIFSIR